MRIRPDIILKRAQRLLKIIENLFNKLINRLFNKQVQSTIPVLYFGLEIPKNSLGFVGDMYAQLNQGLWFKFPNAGWVLIWDNVKKREIEAKNNSQVDLNVSLTTQIQTQSTSNIDLVALILQIIFANFNEPEKFIDAVVADGGIVADNNHTNIVFSENPFADILSPMNAGDAGKLYFWKNLFQIKSTSNVDLIISLLTQTQTQSTSNVDLEHIIFIQS